MELADVYARTRTGLIELAGSLDDGQVTLPVAATPGWSVKDVYAHLNGVCADVLDGRMEGGGSPSWTAEHIRRHSDSTLTEICAEWAERSPQLEDLVRASGPGRMSFPVFDVWTHAQDIRSAIGGAGQRDECVPVLAAAALGVFDHNFTSAGTPATRVVTPTIDYVLGKGEPVATLRTDDYELLRLLVARRSRAQFLAAGWEGESEPPINELHLFDLPEHDLID